MSESSDTLTGNWQDLIGFTDIHSNGNSGVFRWESGYSGYPGIHWHDNATYALTNGSATHINVHDKWCHCCVVFDMATSKVYSYANGALITTTSHLGGHFNSNGAFYLGQTNAIEGRITDVRIYDHALSAVEVKEISQGLVLHYKLDSAYETSMINKYSSDVAEGNCSSTSFTKTKLANERGYKYTYSWTGTGSNSWPNVYFPHFTFTAGKKYVYSVKVRCNTWSAGSISLRAARCANDYYGCASTVVCSSSLADGQWHEYYLIQQLDSTFSASGTTTNTNPHIEFTCSNLNGNGTVYNFDFDLKDIQVVESDTYVSFIDNNMRGEIQDSSGYGHNGTILNTITLSSDTPRYSASTNLTAGNSMINCGRGAMVTDSITVNLWIKYSTWGNPVSCTEGGGWNFENSSGIQFPVYIASVGYKVANAGALPSANTWHMITGTYDRLGQTVNIYIDGELKKSTATGSSNNIGYHGSNVIWLGAEATGSNTTANNGMIGLISDFRIYATPLSANDIKSLYNTAAKIDNLGGLHTFEFQEKGPNKIYKTGITQGQEISEIDGMSNLKYDPNVYIEPDGSAWVRIFHHVNPTSNKFASSDTFTTGVYKDANRWFNFDLCNYINSWEFIAAVTRTNTDTLERYRWIQSANPLTATFDQTKVANVTRITTGYNTSPLGGLYHVSGSSWLAANNGTNNNWFGATGCWTAWNGGIPGWKSTAAGDAVTTGTIDIYLRIDNITATMPPIAKSTKNNIWVGHTLIEK